MTAFLLIGGSGQVGFELQRALQPLGPVSAPGRAELDLTDHGSIRRTVDRINPDVIVNAGGFTIVDSAEADPAQAMQLNATAPGILAECAARRGALLVHFSTTFVFDGSKRTPYTEEDVPNPLNTYGRSKLAGEQAVMAAGGHSVILRASWVYSARRINFALSMLKLAREHRELPVVEDQLGSPTWARDYADATARMLRNPDLMRAHPGIYHLSAESHCSRLQWARRLIAAANAASGTPTGWANLVPTTTADYRLPAARPLYTVTSNRKIDDVFGIRMPEWGERVDAFVRTLPWADPL